MVSSVNRASRTDRKGELTVAFDQITVNGRDYPMRGTVTQAIEGEGIKGETARIGTGAGVGAILGGILGGFKGALAGILIGALYCALAVAAGAFGAHGLAGRLGGTPSRQPGLVHRLDARYFRRVEAVEFAVRYDDGKDPGGILRADVVLLGVSRTSKTPTSMYLAHRQIKVANVPLVPEADLPDEIFQVSPRKIIGLTINPEILLQIRTERLKSLGLGSGSRYADLGRIIEELEYADRVYRRLGCTVVDVSQKAVEETANRILEIVGRT